MACGAQDDRYFPHPRHVTSDLYGSLIKLLLFICNKTKSTIDDTGFSSTSRFMHFGKSGRRCKSLQCCMMKCNYRGKMFFFLFIIMSGLLSFCLNKISLQRRKRKGSSPVVHCGKKGAWGVSAHQPLVAPGSSQGLPDEPTADQSPSEKFKAPRRYKMSLMQWRFPQENQNFKLSTKLQERTGLWSSFLTSGQTPFTHYD